jgi:predicted peptidase
MPRTKLMPIILLLLLITSHASAQELDKLFTAKTFKSASGESLLYRLFVPANYDRRKKYPLIVYLHGSGGLGNDNLKQLQLGNFYMIDRFTQAETQTRYPAFVVAPQTQSDGWAAGEDHITPLPQLRRVVDLIGELRRTYSIDATRLYVAGQSLGGFGTFAIISAYPRMFAAGIPLCGGGNESDAARYKGTALWVFHGEKDASVSVNQSRQMVAAIKKAGGQVKYTEYPGEGHSIWTIVAKEPDLMQWLFSQHR